MTAETKTGILFRVKKIFFPGWLVNRQVKITSLGWIYLGMIFVFGFSAINTGNNLLYLIFGVMVSLLIASFWLSEMNITELEISRYLPREVYAQREFIFKYELKNLKKFFPGCAIRIEEKIAGKISQAYFPLVEAGKSQSYYSKLSLKNRGRCRLNRLSLKTRFPFGFFEKGKQINLKDEIVVFPPLIELKEILPHLSGGWGEFVSLEKGAGLELSGFRDYQPGDHPHWISWKASVRAQRLKVREGLKEKEQKIVIELKLALEDEKNKREKERKISLAMTLSKKLLEQGYELRLELDGKGIDFGRGASQVRRIGYFLALFDDPEAPVGREKLSLISQAYQKIII